LKKFTGWLWHTFQSFIHSKQQASNVVLEQGESKHLSSFLPLPYIQAALKHLEH